MNELKVNQTVSEWYYHGGKELISQYFIDEDRIFTTEAGLKCGVYSVYVVTAQGKEVLSYIGETGRYNRNFRDRFTEHAYNWLCDPEGFTGVLRSELETGYRFKIKITDYITDDEKRYKKEQEIIKIARPYLQSNSYPKAKNNYDGLDLCICKKYRRDAFLNALNNMHKKEYKIFCENTKNNQKKM